MKLLIADCDRLNILRQLIPTIKIKLAREPTPNMLDVLDATINYIKTIQSENDALRAQCNEPSTSDPRVDAEAMLRSASKLLGDPGYDAMLEVARKQSSDLQNVVADLKGYVDSMRDTILYLHSKTAKQHSLDRSGRYALVVASPSKPPESSTPLPPRKKRLASKALPKAGKTSNPSKESTDLKEVDDDADIPDSETGP